jgi:arsenate reductase (thioredoxin)
VILSLERHNFAPRFQGGDQMTTHVLILCTHNSARSIIAEAMLNHLAKQAGRDVCAHSAGSMPSGRVNPLALAVLREAGIDTTGLKSKNWDEFAKSSSPPLSIVITVCDSAAADVCPVFTGQAGNPPVKVHWGYPDPSRVEGDDAKKRLAFESTRLAIAARMTQLLELPLSSIDRQNLATALSRLDR